MGGSQKYEKQKKPSGHLMLHRATVPGDREEPRRTARPTVRERKTSWGPRRLTSLLHFPFLLPPNCCLLIAWGLRVGREVTQVRWRGTGKHGRSLSWTLDPGSPAAKVLSLGLWPQPGVSCTSALPMAAQQTRSPAPLFCLWPGPSGCGQTQRAPGWSPN